MISVGILLIYERVDVKEKIQEENKVVEKALREEMRILKDGTPTIANTSQFFKKIQKEIEPKEQSNNPKMTIDHQGRIEWNILRDALIQSGRRGDFLLALPHHGWPWLFLNIKHDYFMVGHAAVLTKQVDYSIDILHRLKRGRFFHTSERSLLQAASLTLSLERDNALSQNILSCI